MRSRDYVLVCSAPAQARRLVRIGCAEGLLDVLCRCGQPKASLLDYVHICRPASPERWGSDAEPNEEESAGPSDVEPDDVEADDEETSSCTSEISDCSQRETVNA